MTYDAQPAPSEPMPVPGRSRRPVVIGLVVLLLALAGGAAVLLTRGGGSHDDGSAFVARLNDRLAARDEQGAFGLMCREDSSLLRASVFHNPPGSGVTVTFERGAKKSSEEYAGELVALNAQTQARNTVPYGLLRESGSWCLHVTDLRKQFDTALKDDAKPALLRGAQAEEDYFTRHGTYTSSLKQLATEGYKPTPGYALVAHVVTTPGNQSWCLEVTRTEDPGVGPQQFHLTSGGEREPSEGPCPKG